MSGKRRSIPPSMAAGGAAPDDEDGDDASCTPHGKRLAMERTTQAKAGLMERIGYFYDEMQGELDTLIQMEQDHVRRRYLALFDSLVAQSEIQQVMDRVSDRQRAEEFEFQAKEWEDREESIKEDLVRLQKLLMGDFDEEAAAAGAGARASKRHNMHHQGDDNEQGGEEEGEEEQKEDDDDDDNRV